MDKSGVPQTKPVRFRPKRDRSSGEYGNQWNINKIFLSSGIRQECCHDQRFLSVHDIAVDRDFRPEIRTDFLCSRDKSSCRLDGNDDLTGQNGGA